MRSLIKVILKKMARNLKMKLFTTDSDDVMNILLFFFSQLKLLRSFKHNKSTPKVQNIEWADLNHISMVMDDGSIHIVDITSSKTTCSWIQRNSMSEHLINVFNKEIN